MEIDCWLYQTTQRIVVHQQLSSSHHVMGATTFLLFCLWNDERYGGCICCRRHFMKFLTTDSFNSRLLSQLPREILQTFLHLSPSLSLFLSLTTLRQHFHPHLHLFERNHSRRKNVRWKLKSKTKNDREKMPRIFSLLSSRWFPHFNIIIIIASRSFFHCRTGWEVEGMECDIQVDNMTTTSTFLFCQLFIMGIEAFLHNNFLWSHVRAEAGNARQLRQSLAEAFVESLSLTRLTNDARLTCWLYGNYIFCFSPSVL